LVPKEKRRGELGEEEAREAGLALVEVNFSSLSDIA
jgi:hypothetical protein